MTHLCSYPKLSKNSGFSLVELAIGLVIIGLVLGSIITPMSTLRDNSKRSETKSILKDIHDAVIGFAMNNNGRLPCPASATSNGLESLSGIACTQEHGFLPASSLGLQGSYDSNNLLKDAWGNPYRYSFSNTANYQICNQNNCPNANSVLSSGIPAVILSTGKDGTVNINSPDQLENLDSDSLFVSHEPRDGTTTAYDDHIIWISPNILTLYLSR